MRDGSNSIYTDISPKEVDEFVKAYDSLFNGNLRHKYNYSRVVSLTWLNNLLEKNGFREQESVGVISGADDEPELKIISAASASFLNFESKNSYDLDEDWTTKASPGFSFTMCNQVLEHVFNPHVAFRNIIHCTRPGGLIYVTIPTINCIHSDPYFYSSGFHPRFLERMASEHDLQVIGISSWGTPKYMLHAVSGQWLTYSTLRRGIHTRFDIRYPYFIFSDGRNPNDLISRMLRYNNIITDCWGLFRKK